MEITVKWLREEHACLSGRKWFKENYPNGLKVTKRNIKEMMNKLLQREIPFEKRIHKQEGVKYETFRQLHWLLDSLVYETSQTLDLDWRETTKTKFINIWWYEYSHGEPII